MKTTEVSPEHQARILRAEGPGEVKVWRCGVCGRLGWVGTDRTKPDAVIVELTDGSQCPACAQVMQRNPEMYEWVIGVATMAVAYAAERQS